ncbi:MAG: hypothetical protein KKD01_15045 [Proteobacteria bacterium]|nr:hypothetical protein [Pseudomonadota bacterium]MBU1456039.1 hypothetical protein [Pseudomonadota bacterium]
MPRYSCFGIDLLSAVPLALPESQKKDSVEAFVTLVEPAEFSMEKPFLSLSEDNGFTKIVLSAPGVAQFTIRTGKEVFVQPDLNSNSLMIPLYLTGSVLSLLLFQRGLLVLHGSVISINGHGVVFLGHSGAGKSSMAASCLQMAGNLLVADDAAVIRFAKDTVMALPGFPRLKVDNKTVLALNMVNSELTNLEPVIDDEFALHLDKRFSRDAVPLKAIYLLDGGDREEEMEPVSSAAALIKLLQHTIPSRYGENGGPQQFRQLSTLLRSIPVFIFRRPKNLSRLHLAPQILAEHLAALP